MQAEVGITRILIGGANRVRGAGWLAGEAPISYT